MRFDRGWLRICWIAAALVALAGEAFGQITLSSPPLPDAVLGQTYNTSIFTNQTGPVNFSITAGSLPPGLILSGAGQSFITILGTPAKIGVSTFTLQASVVGVGTTSQQYSIAVILPLLITTPSDLPDATVGFNYRETFAAINGTPPYTWFEGQVGLTFGKTSGQRSITLPPRGLTPGLILSPSGTLTGAPTQTGTLSFVISVFDSASSTQVNSGTFNLKVKPPPTVPAATLANGVTGTTYSAPLTAQNGSTPYTWAFNAGTLPPGLTILPIGKLSGTPTAAGTYLFAAKVTDAWGATAVGAITVTITQGLSITTSSPLPNGAVGSAYQLQFGAAGVSPYAWAITQGSLPPGFTLNASSGVLSGTPTAAATYGFTVQLTDSTKLSVSKPFTLTIAPQLVITTSSLANGQPNVAYSGQLAATGGTPPYLWLLTGSLPAGLTLDRSSGAITGTPTNNGASNFTVQVADSAGITATRQLSIAIGPPITFTTPSPLQPNAVVGQPYNQQIAVAGGTPPYTFTQTGLSDGITLDATGKLAGTPPALSTLNFTVTVTDVNHVPATQAYVLAVVAPALPAPTIGGVSDTEPPAQQPTLSLQLANSYPLPLTGAITLTFASTVGNIDDPAIQFSTGGRTATFSVPAGSTNAVFPNGLAIATGTVAGKITLALSFQVSGQDVTPQPEPTRVITIAAQAPVIAKVTASRTSGGLEVDVTGFSNTRDMTSATFQFQASAGTSLQTSQVTIQADQLFATWYNDENSQQFGSQFTFTQPFTISGNASGITNVSVTLTNTQGASSAASASVQ
jgi:hypothetical protein